MYKNGIAEDPSSFAFRGGNCKHGQLISHPFVSTDRHCLPLLGHRRSVIVSLTLIVEESWALIALHVVKPNPDGMISHALSVGKHRTPPVRGLVRPLSRMKSSNLPVATGGAGVGLGSGKMGQHGLG